MKPVQTYRNQKLINGQWGYTYDAVEKVMLGSGDKYLVEDCHWLDGTRTRGELYGTRRDEKNGVFVGRNICGQSLMELRDEVTNK